MAEKKYVDLTGLGQYDAKIKALIDQKDAAKLQEAKEYAAGLGSNYDASGSAATAKSEAIAYVDGKVTDLTTEINAAKSAASTADGKAVAAQGAADAAQADVDALETYVGTIPEGATATDVVGYINEKTEGIATDTALGELQATVTQLGKDIDAVEADYLKAADKTALQGEIEAAQSAAEEAAVDRVLGYLAEETINTDFDTLKEVAAWIEADTTASAELVTRVTTAEGKIQTAEGKITTLEGEMDTVEGKVAALEAAVGESGSVAEDIAEAVAAEAKLREDADTALDGKISANAAAAKAAQDAADKAQGEVDALETVVAGKVAQADHDALAGRVTTAEGKITALEGASHTHENAEVLAGITPQNILDWADAVAKEHEHSNKEVLDGITAAKVTAWDGAEAAAKAYTDEKIAEFIPVTVDEINSLFTA